MGCRKPVRLNVRLPTLPNLVYLFGVLLRGQGGAQHIAHTKQVLVPLSLVLAWDHTRTCGVEWSGVEWSGVEWSGVEWGGVVGWGAERCIPHV